MTNWHKKLKRRLDSSSMEGTLTRSGVFVYPDGDKIKRWSGAGSIKEAHSKYEYLPVIGSKDYGSHKAQLIGFVHNFTPNDETEQMLGDVEFFDEIENLTDLNITDDLELEVSMGFDDIAHPADNFQYITSIDHYAVSLNNLEKGRCRSANGEPCVFKFKTDMEVTDNLALMKKTPNEKAELRDSKEPHINNNIKKDDSKMTKKDKKITEDVASPGSITDPEVAKAKERELRVADCVNNGHGNNELCNNAVDAMLNNGEMPSNTMTASAATNNFDFEGVTEKLANYDKVMAQFADFLPVMEKMYNKLQSQEEAELAQVRQDLIAKGVCPDKCKTMDLQQAKFALSILPDIPTESAQEIRDHNEVIMFGPKKGTKKVDFIESARQDYLEKIYGKVPMGGVR